MKSTFLLLSLVLLFSACAIEPKPIQYGEDNCHYCNMTIVDRQHAAQIVTEKGRAYSFDAIECMVNFKQDYKGPNIALFLVADYDSPGELLPAEEASFIISKEISSPMGANLSAFNNEEKAAETISTHGGNLFDWKQLQKQLQNPLNN
ncbi:nitrous oxide reductase accessory protein NosL [Luteirhabdus pelagi]|uniref:nitrous oxide reductase accessory protein NosL n=1 Tax=Luteirhabdus pelagi TaxID=2792783 RepID=UPI00193A9A70|nr:nitrous oxide reductase accessory protein NosL [Luteirhabdus pelagi]